MCEYLNWKVWLRSRPDVQVSMTGFCDRGVILKARRILASMGVCKYITEIRDFEAVRE